MVHCGIKGSATEQTSYEKGIQVNNSKLTSKPTSSLTGGYSIVRLVCLVNATVYEEFIYDREKKQECNLNQKSFFS